MNIWNCRPCNKYNKELAYRYRYSSYEPHKAEQTNTAIYRQ